MCARRHGTLSSHAEGISPGRRNRVYRDPSPSTVRQYRLPNSNCFGLSVRTIPGKLPWAQHSRPGQAKSTSFFSTKRRGDSGAAAPNTRDHEESTSQGSSFAVQDVPEARINDYAGDDKASGF